MPPSLSHNLYCRTSTRTNKMAATMRMSQSRRGTRDARHDDPGFFRVSAKKCDSVIIDSAREARQRNGERFNARVARIAAEFGFDAEQLVVFGDSIGARY